MSPRRFGEVFRQEFTHDLRRPLLWILLLIVGRLAVVVGRRKVFAGGMLVFAAGSVLCALSPSLPVLLLMRVVQATGVVMLEANSLSVMARACAPARRDRAIDAREVVASMASLIAPVIAAALISYLSWRVVFLAEIPVALRLVLP